MIKINIYNNSNKPSWNKNHKLFSSPQPISSPNQESSTKNIYYLIERVYSCLILNSDYKKSSNTLKYILSLLPTTIWIHLSFLSKESKYRQWWRKNILIIRGIWYLSVWRLNSYYPSSHNLYSTSSYWNKPS